MGNSPSGSLQVDELHSPTGVLDPDDAVHAPPERNESSHHHPHAPYNPFDAAGCSRDNRPDLDEVFNASIEAPIPGSAAVAQPQPDVEILATLYPVEFPVVVPPQDAAAYNQQTVDSYFGQRLLAWNAGEVNPLCGDMLLAVWGSIRRARRHTHRPHTRQPHLHGHSFGSIPARVMCCMADHMTAPRLRCMLHRWAYACMRMNA